MAGDSISTNKVWPNYAAANVQKAAAKPNDGTLGKDDFLKILITQLKNQDPMEPLKDRDFIAQMAQFSSVEQLVNMSKQLTALRQNLGMASSLIGKEIQWTETGRTGDPVVMNGRVESIVVRDGVQYVKSGKSEVAIDSILSISGSGEEAAAANE